MHSFKKVFSIIIFSALVLFVEPKASAQCAMCKSNLEKARDGGDTRVGNTINHGIMYLFVLPYAIAGVFGYIYYKKHKEKKIKEQIHVR